MNVCPSRQSGSVLIGAIHLSVGLRAKARVSGTHSIDANAVGSATAMRAIWHFCSLT